MHKIIVYSLSLCIIMICPGRPKKMEAVSTFRTIMLGVNISSPTVCYVKRNSRTTTHCNSTNTLNATLSGKIFSWFVTKETRAFLKLHVYTYIHIYIYTRIQSHVYRYRCIYT